MSALFVAFVFAVVPAEYPCQSDACDLLEVNHYYDENGNHMLDQILFREWNLREARYDILAWRLLKTDAQFPRPCDEGWETTWREGASICRVTAPKFRESWTQYDPDLIEQKHLPKDQRKGIFRKGKRDEP